MVSLLPADEAETSELHVPAAHDPMPVEDAVVLAARLKAIAEPTRLRLLSLVAAHDGHEACVCDLTEPVNLSQPTVSHHLKILVEAGLLTRSKRGSWAFYALVPGALETLADGLRASFGDQTVSTSPAANAR
jgi:ArsR family transcriptional regulator